MRKSILSSLLCLSSALVVSTALSAPTPGEPAPDRQADEDALVVVQVEAWSSGAAIEGATIVVRGVDPDRPWLDTLETMDRVPQAKGEPGPTRAQFELPVGAKIGIAVYDPAYGCTEKEVTVKADDTIFAQEEGPAGGRVSRRRATIRVELPPLAAGADARPKVEFRVNARGAQFEWGRFWPVVVRSPRFGCVLEAHELAPRKDLTRATQGDAEKDPAVGPGVGPGGDPAVDPAGDSRLTHGAEFFLPPGKYRLTYEERRMYLCGNGSPWPQDRTFVDREIEVIQGQDLAVEGMLGPGLALRLMLQIGGREARVRKMLPDAIRISESHWTNGAPELPWEDPAASMKSVDLLATVSVRPLGAAPVLDPAQCGRPTQRYVDVHEMIPIGAEFFTSRVYPPGSYDVTVRGPGIVSQTTRVEVPDTKHRMPVQVIKVRPRGGL